MTIDALALVAVALIGLVVGSFLNVVADRTPRDESIIAPRSHCDACGRTLAPLDMIPVLSYVWLRGRCRWCSAPIGLRSPLLEITAAACALLAWNLYGPTWRGLMGVCFLWLFLLLSVMDIEHHIVSRPIVVGGLALSLVVSPLWLANGVAGALLGGLVAGLPYVLLYIIAGRIYGRGKGLGLGDVWVATLMGVATGFPWAVLALLVATLSSAAAAIALLVMGRMGRRDALPTVPFFALGALAGILFSAGFGLRLLVS
jgi:leader peptidase (prepilin peptidase)/N-methyltransferase